MIILSAIVVIAGPVVYGKVATCVAIDTQFQAGISNRFGVVLAGKSSIFMSSPTLKDRFVFPATSSGFFLEKSSNGAVIGNTNYDNKGKRLYDFSDLIVNGINSTGDVVGYSRDSASRLDRATVVVAGAKKFVSYQAAPDYVPILDQFILFSQAFDIDDQGRVLVVSLPRSVDGNKVNPLRPYIIEGKKQTPLTIHTGYTDVFPLKFAFDGSIIGWAWEKSTIVNTGWSGGFGQTYSTTFLRWPSATKTTKPSVGWTQNGETLSNLVDASGPYVVGAVRNDSTELISPVLWVNGNPTKIKIPGKVSVDRYLGFVKADTVACLGDVNGKWSVFTVVLPKPK